MLVGRCWSVDVGRSLSFGRCCSVDVGRSMSFGRCWSVDVGRSLLFGRCWSIDVGRSLLFGRCWSVDVGRSLLFGRCWSIDVVRSIYNALVHPLNARWTKSRVLPTLCGLWALSLGGSSVQLFVTSAQKTHHFYQCEERWPVTPHELYKKLYTVAVLIFTFVFPLTCLAHSYVSIVSMMCRHKLPGNADASRDRQRNLSKAKAINMMLAVVICFTICWMPMHILMLLITFCKEVSRCYSNSECFPYYMSVFVCHWIAMSNSFMNPFIYCFMSNNFREDLLQFTRRCRGRRRSQASLRGSDPGSSGRTALYVTHRTSSKGKTLTRHGCCTPETQHHYGCIHAHEMTARQQFVQPHAASLPIQSGPPLVLIQIVNSNINFMINSSNDNYMINSSINRCKDNCMTNSSKDNCMINRSNNSNIC
ncbi:hypothetical protein HAZT_HAZT006392 [Hyalella azteca]|uniref:G-protein coupled receptors family 1 profile domain-containing protein n=1 Tax=Hyalella azteca TaxID=294128 RepID=A0A6A0H811_HYAAZ|nr:hypothetical protein HAZT_HAZT006392 [Hyalella azteca]